MPSLEAIRQNAHELVTDGELRQACLDLIQFVDENWERARNRDLRMQFLSKAVGRPPTDAVFFRCVQLLSTAESLRLLDPHFLVFDPEDPEDIGHKVQDEDVARAFESGYLVHPDSGDRIEGFEGWLVPYFRLHELPKGD